MIDASLAGTDKGYTFQGPQVVYRTMPLATGLTLEANHVSGVVISENPASPLHDATLYGHGTRIKDEDGKVTGDVQLVEFTVPDGDVFWMSHIWWYGQGPGRYQILDGTGKWAGITGLAMTLGHLRRRADDHYMVKWDMHWRIDNREG